MPEHQQTQKSTESKTTSQRQATPRIQAPISHPMAIIQRARINPKSLTHADVMQLQRTIGNRAVGRLLSEIGLIPSKAKQAQTVQRQELVQRQEIPEEEELLQGKFENKPEIACPSCSATPIVQRQEIPEEEEPLQTKKENNTGMPDNLKAGVESLSGIDMSDVRVHYNSSKPAEVGALAYTQGTDIHVAQGQEKHLPHEAWHVVQQAQGRVRPTMQMRDGGPVNDDEGLEHEADVMGENAAISEYLATKCRHELVSHKTDCGCQACGGVKSKHPTLGSVTQLCRFDSSCPNPDPCKLHPYTPDIDPSLFGDQGFYSPGSQLHFVAEEAMRLQQQGKTPEAQQVRVRAFRMPYQRSGAGADEALPTDMRGVVAAGQNPAQIGFQSGARSATDKTLLQPPGMEAAAHTGMFPKLVGAGSTNTKGQAKAHDVRRRPLISVAPLEQFFEMHRNYVQSLATGPAVISSSVITGGIPNWQGAKRVGPVSQPGSGVDETRRQVAYMAHENREHQKIRGAAVAFAMGIPRPYSPERGEMQPDGSGGWYLPPGVPGRPSSPVPSFGGIDDTEKFASMAAYLTGPGRHGAAVHNLNRICKNCGEGNSMSDTHCRKCKNLLL